MHFFCGFIDVALFDRGLDFAIRAWIGEDASVRPRMVYFLQLGYHALGVQETMAARLSRLPGYLEGFTGRFLS